MAIPKRIRRSIKVNGMEYEYCVRGFVYVFIKNLATGKTYTWWDDWKPKWKQSIKPSDIREMILDNKL